MTFLDFKSPKKQTKFFEGFLPFSEMPFSILNYSVIFFLFFLFRMWASRVWLIHWLVDGWLVSPKPLVTQSTFKPFLYPQLSGSVIVLAWCFPPWFLGNLWRGIDNCSGAALKAVRQLLTTSFSIFWPRGVRNDFWPRFYIVVLGIAFLISAHLLFPISIWTFISLFTLDFYFPFFFGLLFSLFSLDFYSIAVTHLGFFQVFFFNSNLLFSIFIWTFIFPFLFGLLFSLDFYFPFSLWTFISLFSLDFYSHFGFLPKKISLFELLHLFNFYKQYMVGHSDFFFFGKKLHI